MTNTSSHAETELSVLLKTSPDNELENFRNEIIALCERFGNSGQSGGSAPYIATFLGKSITKLCLQEPISPISGIEDEWHDVGNGLHQNKRCSALFKQDDNIPHYLDAIVFKEPSGCGFTGSVKSSIGEITSVQSVKSFPFTPKTFYIDVVADGEYWNIKNINQLGKVFKYYSKI